LFSPSGLWDEEIIELFKMIGRWFKGPNSINISNNFQKNVKILFSHPLPGVDQRGLNLVELFGVKGSEGSSDFLNLFLDSFPGVLDDFTYHVVVGIGSAMVHNDIITFLILFMRTFWQC
jgi:hypothetical protein